MARTHSRRIGLVPRIDTWPWLVAFVQGPVGKLAVLATFAVGLRLHGRQWWLDATVVLAALTVWPERRRLLLLAGTWYWLGRHTLFDWALVRGVARRGGVGERIDWSLFEPAVIASVLLFCVAYVYAVRRYAGSRILRRPILVLLALYVVLLLIASYAPSGWLAGELGRTRLWAFLLVLGRYLWVLCYSVADQRARGKREIVTDLGHYLPFWFGASATPTPFPKGSAYLRKTEAKNAGELAVCQLKAVKLLWWAGIVMVLHELLKAVAYGDSWHLQRMLGMTADLGIPTLDDAFARSLEGAPYVWYVGWAALVTHFLTTLLSLTIWGHLFIATCRMSGFNVLRNTYRPLESRTIAEFWNRYYYYFKELLVDFFFYPTYLRCFRSHPRLRLFFATMMAAGFGNFLYHFLRDPRDIAQLGLWGALLTFRVYGFYSLLLGVAIGLSQIRGRRRGNPPPSLQRRLLAPLFVLTFYCVLSVFDEPDRSLSLRDHFVFLLTLIGVA